MPEETFGRYELGFISEEDLNTSVVAKSAFRDGYNFEINDPLFALRKSAGYSNEFATNDPDTLDGSRNVAYHMWGVSSNPGMNKLHTLIRTSENLLKFSEDFEITSAWTKSGVGTTLTANFDSGLKRRADRFSIPSGGTGTLTQALSSSELGLVKGKTIFGSVHLQSVSVGSHSVAVKIIETGGSNPGTTTANFSPIAGTFTRYSVSRAIASDATGVSFEFTITANVSFNAEISVWGAQLETNSLTGYGYTFNFTRPYYVYLRPYYDGASWVDNWIELTERRAGIASSVATDTFVLTAMGETNDYFNRWKATESTTSPSLFTDLITDYVSSTATFTRLTQLTDIANGDVVILDRSPVHLINQYSQWNISSESKISFASIKDGLRISFGTSLEPLVIQYISTTVFSATKPLIYSEFRLELRAFYDAVSGTINSGFKESGIILEFRVGAAGALSGTLSGVLVAVMDNYQKVVVSTATVSLTNQQLDVAVRVKGGFYSPRIVTLELYFDIDNTSSLSNRDNYRLSASDHSFSAGTWTINGSHEYERVISYNATPVSTQPTMFENTGKAFSVQANVLPKYFSEGYVNGRSYVGGTSENLNYLRFSSIRGVVSEVDLFPFKENEGYGFITFDNPSGSEIKGVTITGDNNILLFREQDAFLYEVGSGRVFGKKLLQVFKNVGLVHQRLLSHNTDYGTFWLDDNDAYLYRGGIEQPRRVSQNRITNYIRRTLRQYLPTAFVMFDRKKTEFLLFTQVSGSIGSTDANDYRILRYSPVKDNWNIVKLGVIPVWVSSDPVSGEVKILPKTGNVLSYSGTGAIALPAATLTTHRVPVGGNLDIGKVIDSVFAEYETNQNFTIDVLVDHETSTRNGNSLTFLSTKKKWNRGIRSGTIVNTASLKITEGTASTLKLILAGINYEPREPRHATRK